VDNRHMPPCPVYCLRWVLPTFCLG
jgi:hypothetical protein